jgi:hypothetical protein
MIGRDLTTATTLFTATATAPCEGNENLCSDDYNACYVDYFQRGESKTFESVLYVVALGLQVTDVTRQTIEWLF